MTQSSNVKPTDIKTDLDHSGHDHDHDDHGHDHDDHDHGGTDGGWLSHWPLLSALLILVIMQVIELGFKIHLQLPIALPIYSIAYLLAGYNVLYLA